MPTMTTSASAKVLDTDESLWGNAKMMLFLAAVLHNAIAKLVFVLMH